MPRLYKGHKFILCIIDEVTDYLITVPIHQFRSRRNIGCINREYYLKVVCTQLHYNGPRQCIHIYTDEYILVVPEA